jgi:hypothetical protein
MRLTVSKTLFVLPLVLFSMMGDCQVPANGAAGSGGAGGSVQGVVNVQGSAAAGMVVGLSPLAAPQMPKIPEVGEYVIRDGTNPPQPATVDGAGSFKFDDVPAGEYALIAYKIGYFDQDASLSDERYSARMIHKVRVFSGKSSTVNVQLVRGGSIEGRVFFSDGRPAHTGKQVVDEVAVNVEVETAPGKFNRFGGAAHTDADGRYSIEGLPTARYIVFAALPGEMVKTTRGLMGASGRLIFAPGSLRTSKAEVVEVQSPATRTDVNIEVATEGLHPVSGKLVDRAGAPVTTGLVRLFPTGEPELSLSTPLGIDGEFSFADLPDDTYTVSFESYGGSRAVGMTEDKTGFRMFREKAPFAPASVEVHVSGQNPAPVVIVVKPMP